MSPNLPPPPPTAVACADVEAMLAAYALGILEAAEERAVAAHLAGCPACRARLARSGQVVAALDRALAPAPPPPALRPRLLAEVALGAAPARPVLAHPARDALRWRRVAGALAAAALLLVGLGLTGGLLLQARNANDDAAGDRRQIAAYLSHGGTVTSLARVPGAPGTGARGSLIVAPNQPQALVVVAGLAPPAGERRYRVWVARGGQRTWLAELEVGSDGSGYLLVSAPAPLATYDTVGVARAAPGQPARDLLTAPIRAGP